MPKLAFALDKDSIRDKDGDGHLHVAATPISKAVVNPYQGNEIPDWEKLGLDPERVYQLYRDPKELEKAAETFDGKPLLFQHKPTTSDDHQTDLVVGAVKNPVWKPPYLMAELTVWPGEAIDAIESGAQRELSCGYRYVADMTPGTVDGVPYDGVMRDIVGNHVAIVEEGRAGKDVVIGDAAMSNPWAKFANDAPSGKLNEKEEAVANRTPEEREETPESVFLEPAGRKYPVKTKQDGEWKYSRDLLLAAARRARMNGNESLAKRADAIRNREFAQDTKGKHMLKTAQTRKATLVQGALMAHLGPMLAKDVKLNLTPIVAKITAKNYVASKPKIFEAIKLATDSKLVKDAKLEDVHKLLDSLDREEPGEDEEVMPKEGSEKLDNREAMDWPAKMGRVMDYLRTHGARDEDLEAVDAICKEGAMDETDEEREERERKAKQGEDQPPVTERTPKGGAAEGRDKGRGAMDNMISKTALDAALKKNGQEVEAATMKRLDDIRIAERAVKSLVGDVTLGLDSAEKIYRGVLASDAVKSLLPSSVDIAKVDSSALPALVAMAIQVKEQANRPGLRLASDNAAPMSDRAAFEKDNGIPPMRIRNLG